jgi:uncharacterized membrane protein (UPF0127 family)
MRRSGLSLIAVSLLWILEACQASDSPRPSGGSAQPTPAPSPRSDPTAQDFQMPALPRARVLLKDAYGGSHAVDAEVAASDPARARGLMWRSELPEGKAMLFIFPRQEVHSFWMRNTLIPLDLIFIGEDKKIVGIVRQAEPKTTAPRTVKAPSLYVLELPGGWAEKNGIQTGSPVEVQGISNLRVEP